MKHKWLSQVGAQACAVAMAATLMLSVTASPASAADADPIRIGVLTDLSGKYADLSGAGTVTAIKMAVADFGGKVLDRPIEVMVADHQNKPDVAAAVAREWIDQKHVQVLMDFMDSAAGLAVVKVAAQKNTISIVNGAAPTRTARHFRCITPGTPMPRPMAPDTRWPEAAASPGTSSRRTMPSENR